MKVKDILTDESKWCKGSKAKNRWGDNVGFDSDEAVQWCLVGALLRAKYTFKARLDIWDKLRQFLGICPESWNDRPERKFEDVRKLIEDLDI